MISMVKLIIFTSLVICLIPGFGSAQQIRVEKIKGNKAVVEFSGNLVTGKSYSLATGPSNTLGSRQYVLGGGLSLVSSTYSISTLSATVKHSDLNLSARFGWNFENYELGPIFGYRNVDSDYSSQHFSSFSGGVFGDYNLSPNRPGENTIFGITGEGIFGSLSPSSGSGGSTMEFFVGGFLKWFGITDSTALRADLGYDYLKTSAGTTNNTLQGFVLRGGLATYF